MRYLRYWTNTLVLVVPLVPVGISGYLTVRHVFTYLNTNQRLAGTLSAEATRKLGREVRVGDVKITGNLWGFAAHNEVELRDVSVAATAAADSPILARIGRVVVGYNLQQVLSGKSPSVPIVDAIALYQPQAQLVRDSKGQWNFTPLLEKLRSTTGTTTRSFVSKIVLTDAQINYRDESFPHPVGVPKTALITRLQNVSGVALIRSDSSVAFDVKGLGQTGLVQNFKAAGVIALKPLVISARLVADGVALPALGVRVLPTAKGRIASGTANVDINAVYTPPADTPLPAFDLKALTASGTVQLADVTANVPQSGSPISDVSGTIAFTMDAAQVDLRGQYAGVAAQAKGTILHLPLQALLTRGAKFQAKDFQPVLALQGAVQNVDFVRLTRHPLLAPQIAHLPAKVREQILALRGLLADTPFRIVGTLDNPAVAVNIVLPQLQTHDARFRAIHLSATLADHTVHAELHGSLAGGGDFGLRGQAELTSGKLGAYHIITRGRSIHLHTMQALIPGKHTLRGEAQFDAIVRGQGKALPQVQGQAELSDVVFDGQAIHTVYAAVGTSEKELILRTARIEDEKGYAVANGTINLKTQALDLNAEADLPDLESLTQAVLDYRPDLAKKAALHPGKYDLNGAVFVRGSNGEPAHITGTLKDPKVQAHITAFNLQFDNIGIDEADATLDATKDQIEVTQGRAVRAAGDVNFEGIVADLRGKEPSVSLTASVNGVDLNYLAQAAGMNTADFPITGTVSTTKPVLVTGTLSAPRVREPFTVVLDDFSVDGLPVFGAFARADYGPEGLHLIEAGAQVADGTLTANGFVHANGQLELATHLNDFQLDALTGLLPDALEPLHGTITASATVTGTAANPDATLAFDAQKLTYNNGPIGHLQGKARYDNNRLTVENVALTDLGGAANGGARIDIAALTYDNPLKPGAEAALNGTASWSGISLLGIRDLLQKYADADPGAGGSPDSFHAAAQTLAQLTDNVQADTSGEITLSGTSAKPQITFDWNDIPLTIGGYPLLLTAGRANIGKEEANIPLVHLIANGSANSEENDGTVDIKVPFVKYRHDSKGRWDDQNNLKIEVTTSSINLHLLQTWLTPTGTTTTAAPDTSLLASLRGMLATQGDAPEVGGTAVFAADISGKTLSPEIDHATLNLADLTLSRLMTADERQKSQLSLKTLKNQAAQKSSTRVNVFRISRFDVNSMTFKDGILRSDDLGISIGNTQVRGSAQVTDLQWQPPFVLPTATYHAEAKLRLRDETEQNLQEVAALFPSFLDSHSVGRITASASVDKKPDSVIQTSGTVRLQAPRLQLAAIRTGLRDVDATFDLKENALVIQNFAAKTQTYNEKNEPEKETGSPISLTGRLPLILPDGVEEAPGSSIKLHTDRALFAERPVPGSKTGAVRGVASIDLNVTRSLAAPRLAGSITVSDAQLALPSDFGGLPAGTGKVVVNPEFNIALNLGKNVGVSNALLNTKLTGTVGLKGSLASPELNGVVALNGGRLSLATTRLTIQKPSTITVNYPVYDRGQPGLGLNVDIKAEGILSRVSTSGTRTRERVSFQVSGPLTGESVDPDTGQSRLRITSNNANFDQDTLLQSLSIGDQSRVGQIGANPGQALTGLLTNALTGSFLPGLFDSTASQLGFDELSIDYDPLQNLNLNVSRHILGPFYASYTRVLNGVREQYTVRVSARLRDQLQASYEVNELNEQRILLEGVWRF